MVPKIALRPALASMVFFWLEVRPLARISDALGIIHPGEFPLTWSQSIYDYIWTQPFILLVMPCHEGRGFGSDVSEAMKKSRKEKKGRKSSSASAGN
jgi:hypothetical protein